MTEEEAPLWLSSIPTGAVDPPAVVSALAGGREITPVWRNELGGLTFQIGDGSDRIFLKWLPAGARLDLGDEVARLRWARSFAAVPLVLDEGADEAGSWIVTAGLPGTTAVAERWKKEPEVAVRALGEGLRALHDALPVESCPFSWRAEERVADASARIDGGSFNRDYWDRCDHGHLSPEQALAIVAEVPAVDRLVVCHGDACSPNTLITDDGRWSGHVDLGSLGLADRWADLAIATWSSVWNYGPGWEDLLLSSYGVDPDPERTAYYRLLWDLGP